jgi:glycosyltransferase involved in cell wall biosynthesis
MDIAFVSNVVYPFVTGGAEKRIYEFGTRLVDRGHRVTVYGRQFWDGAEEMTYDGMQLRAVAKERDLYVNGRRSLGEAVGFAAALWPPLCRHIAEHDVVVTSVFPYFPVISAATLTFPRDVPLVTTWHECWREYWWEYLGSSGIGGIAVERLVANLPQQPIAVSSLTADRVAAIGPERDRITVVPNGIDYARIRNTEPVADGFDILFVGRLIEAKRVGTLLRAVASSGREPRIGVIGDGPERDRLERLANALDIAPQVSFLGFLEKHDRVLAHLRRADVFVSPSVREGFGLTLVEAMAADCTVVAVDHPCSAAAEVVDDAGFLVGPGITSLQRGIERALAGDRPSAPPTQRAQVYGWGRITDKAESAYRAAATGAW